MNNVKLLHIKCCFFQFFNSPVALKNKKKFGPQEKVEMAPLPSSIQVELDHGLRRLENRSGLVGDPWTVIDPRTFWVIIMYWKVDFNAEKSLIGSVTTQLNVYDMRNVLLVKKTEMDQILFFI